VSDVNALKNGSPGGGGGGGGSTPSSGPVSWNDITDKPVYPSIVTYKYSKDIEYSETMQNGTSTFVKISNDTPAKEDFYGNPFVMDYTMADSTEVEHFETTLSEDVLLDFREQSYGTDGFMVVLEDFEEDGVYVTSGVWAAPIMGDLMLQSLTISALGEKISESAIPDTILRKSELAEAIAEVMPTWTGGSY
jgi:hypothetical protein